MKFRFHTGSIKSTVAQPTAKVQQSFDSILVRLKVKPIVPRNHQMGKFRFHTGSIKSLDLGSSGVGVGCFDSILVRLKVLEDAEVFPCAAVSIPYWFD